MPDLSIETVVVVPSSIRLVRRADTKRWQAHFKVDILGLWIRRATGTEDLEQAKAKAMKLWAKAQNNAEEGYPVRTKKFKAVAEVVLQDLERKVAVDRKRRGSNNDYISAINRHLIPFFGNYNVDRINQQVFSQFCVWREETVGKELSHSTQANHNAALNLVFDYAVERGYMTEMMRPVLKNTGEHGMRRPDFTVEGVKAIGEFMPSWVAKTSNSRSKLLRELLMQYVPFAALTGMRPGTEMDYLEWRHIEMLPAKTGDAELGLIAYVLKGKTVKKEKPAATRLPRECWPVLTRLAEMAPEFEGMSIFDVLKSKSDKFVFRTREGTQPNQLTKQFKQLLTEMNILKCGRTGQDRTLYSLRHYAITQMLLRGIPADVVAKQVRTSQAMIDKYYNHVQPMLIDAFGSVGEVRDDDEISKLLRTAQNDDMLHFAEMCSGITLSLAMQSKPALDTLRDELAKKKKQPS
jgi:integrase